MSAAFLPPAVMSPRFADSRNLLHSIFQIRWTHRYYLLGPQMPKEDNANEKVDD